MKKFFVIAWEQTKIKLRLLLVFVILYNFSFAEKHESTVLVINSYTEGYLWNN